MLYREIIAVCSEIHTKHINTQCGQNVELLNIKPVGTRSTHQVNTSIFYMARSQGFLSRQFRINFRAFC